MRDLVEGDGEALLRAVARDPAADVPLLVLADWLEENNEAEECRCASLSGMLLRERSNRCPVCEAEPGDEARPGGVRTAWARLIRNQTHVGGATSEAARILLLYGDAIAARMARVPPDRSTATWTNARQFEYGSQNVYSGEPSALAWGAIGGMCGQQAGPAASTICIWFCRGLPMAVVACASADFSALATVVAKYPVEYAIRLHKPHRPDERGSVEVMPASLWHQNAGLDGYSEIAPGVVTRAAANGSKVVVNSRVVWGRDVGEVFTREMAMELMPSWSWTASAGDFRAATGHHSVLRTAVLQRIGVAGMSKRLAVYDSESQPHNVWTMIAAGGKRLVNWLPIGMSHSQYIAERDRWVVSTVAGS